MKLRRRLATMLAGALCACALAPEAGVAATDGMCVVDGGGLPRPCVACVEELGVQGSGGRILAPDGTVLGWADPVATGDLVESRDSSGRVARRELVVLGDVTGSGKASLTQLARMSDALRGGAPLTGAYALAADLSGSGSLDLSDLVRAAFRYRSVARVAERQAETRSVPLYIATPDDPLPCELSFLDGCQDIPYISASTAATLFSFFYTQAGNDPPLQTSVQEGAVLWTRPNGSGCRIDFVGSTIVFDDYNSFMALPGAETSLDLVGPAGTTLEGMCQRLESSFVRQGRPVCFDLGPYGISLADAEGGLIPLQTFCDIFLGRVGSQILYNGENLFMVMSGSLGTLRELYYSVPTRERSAELGEYSYNELCLALDSFYGLKEQHDISSFAELARQTGLEEALKGTDPKAADAALATLCTGYLGDLHTWFTEPSCMSGADADIQAAAASPAVAEMRLARARYRDARSRAYPDGVPGYEEVGDTAYVTVDRFRLPDDHVDYRQNPPGPDAEDTIGQVIYAHTRIMRPDSPIRNVVLDLSCNGGGDVQAAAYLAGWFLGGAARLDVNDTFTGSQASMAYAVDVNGDGQSNASDSVRGLNLFALISPVSFSCGNFVPSCLAASDQVTLLGRKSGGGACFVWPMSTADGSLLRISGPMRMSMMMNGSYYDIDKGIRPDFILSRIESFYDREALTRLIQDMP